MRKIYYFLIIIVLFQIIVSVNPLHSQYVLKPAFPNLSVFSAPLEIVNAGDGSNRLFVVEQKGKIYTFQDEPNVSNKKLFIDLSSIVNQSGYPTDLGLLGLAFHPDYENNRFFYVYYIADSSGNSTGLWTRIARFTASSTNPDSALLSSQVKVLSVSQPGYQHKAGKMAFGPDGFLYISLGDGGIFNDVPGNAQSKSSLLGKVLRINVDSSSTGRNYSIPSTNPFFGNPSGYKEEIFSYGFRNLWKFSIDPPTGLIFGGDVGQFRFEEIDLIQNGKNYGWNKMEGNHCYPDTNICDTTGKNFTRPVLELRRNTAVSIIGGYIYRGSLFPELYGKYIFGDWWYGSISAMNYNPVGTSTYFQLLDSTIQISSFGLSEQNELYVCNFDTATGMIYKMSNAGTITLNLKAILEGHYDENADLLKVRDSVDVILHSSSSPNPIIDSVRIAIDSLTFSGLCFFRIAPSGIYYINVKFRNGLETWSKPGGENYERGGYYSYDFTSDSSNAYGLNLKLKGSRLCVISGDCNQDGVINAIDRAIVVEQLGMTGQMQGDLDGNRVVNAIDRAIVVGNLGKSKAIPDP